MKRDELQELGFITPIASVPSILQRGILCHRLAEKVPHESLANQSVQSLRANKIVPGGSRLHDYANLYICPRNPMMYVLKDRHEETCVLRVNASVLDLPGVIVTDMNAARTYAMFRPAPEGLEIVDREMTFAISWNHQDPGEKDRRRGFKCAEVLVPKLVPPEYIAGAYVSCDKSREALAAVADQLAITVNPDLFFR